MESLNEQVLSCKWMSYKLSEKTALKEQGPEL